MQEGGLGIEFVVVASRHRGLGLAAAAVRCVEAEMAAAGCRAHEIDALPAAERFWCGPGL